jgi:hypothetical protein
MAHPDHDEAAEWVAAEIQRLRALSYEELLGDLNASTHYRIESRTGRVLMGETQVFYDSEDGGPVRVLVDVCEPRRGIVRSIASDDFIRAPDGAFFAK